MPSNFLLSSELVLEVVRERSQQIYQVSVSESGGYGFVMDWDAVEAEDLLVVARQRFEIRSKILGCEISIQSAALIVSGSFVSAALSNINIFAVIA
jgi:hypothetical protein